MTTHKISLMLFCLLVLALAMINPSSQSFPKGNPLQKWHLHVVNKLSTGHILFLHCKSKDDDLGTHYLRVGSEFSWGFTPNYWGTTLFWCYMRTNKAHAAFNVFWPSYDDWLFHRCDSSDCIRKAKDDRIYLQNIPEKRDELVHKWEPGAQDNKF